MTGLLYPPITIPLSTPWFDDREEQRVLQTLRSGWVSTASPVVQQFEQAFAQTLGCAHTVATNSGTAALHLALKASGVGPGDEVIVPALTFTASVNPVLYVGATPVFADVEADTLGLSVRTVQPRLTSRTRAVVAVHLFGMAADVVGLRTWCQANQLLLLEDAAEALGTTIDGQAVGTFGQLGTFSFNGNKVITTGSGGAIACPDEALAARMRALSAQDRLLGTDELEHVGVGFNYRMNALQAALGLAQLEKLTAFVARRTAIALFYRRELAECAPVLWPEADSGVAPSCWLSCLLVPRAEQRLPLIHALRLQGIESRPFFKPLPLQPHFQPYLTEQQRAGGPVDHAFATAVALWQRGVCIPSSPQLADADLERVVAAIRQFFKQTPGSFYEAHPALKTSISPP